MGEPTALQLIERVITGQEHKIQDLETALGIETGCRDALQTTIDIAFAILAAAVPKYDVPARGDPIRMHPKVSEKRLQRAVVRARDALERHASARAEKLTPPTQPPRAS